MYCFFVFSIKFISYHDFIVIDLFVGVIVANTTFWNSAQRKFNVTLKLVSRRWTWRFGCKSITACWKFVILVPLSSGRT